jgi:hypothetical protein
MKLASLFVLATLLLGETAVFAGHKKLKELDLESETFSLDEIAYVFAGRFDLFVYSFCRQTKK